LIFNSPSKLELEYNLIYVKGHSGFVSRIEFEGTKLIEPAASEGFMGTEEKYRETYGDVVYYLFDIKTGKHEKLTLKQINNLDYIRGDTSPDGAKIVNEEKSNKKPQGNFFPETGLISEEVKIDKEGTKIIVGESKIPVNVIRAIGWIKNK